jgi:hypothetical protein
MKCRARHGSIVFPALILVSQSATGQAEQEALPHVFSSEIGAKLSLVWKRGPVFPSRERKKSKKREYMLCSPGIGSFP